MHAVISFVYFDGGFSLATAAHFCRSAGSGVFMLLDMAISATQEAKAALARGATLSMVASAATQAEWDAVRRAASDRPDSA